jgi:hypothetical protein
LNIEAILLHDCVRLVRGEAGGIALHCVLNLLVNARRSAPGGEAAGRQR